MYDTDLTTASTASSGASPGTMLVQVAFLVLSLAGLWKMFTKAGQPGWAAIVPIYNLIVLLKIVGRPLWWILLLLLPLVNIVVLIILSLDVAKSYGKSVVFAIFGLIIFSFVGYPMLGFGSATYRGPRGAGVTPDGATPAGPTPPPAMPTTPQAPAA